MPKKRVNDLNSSITLALDSAYIANQRAYSLRLNFSKFIAVLVHNDVVSNSAKLPECLRSLPESVKFTRAPIGYTMERALARQGRARARGLNANFSQYIEALIWQDSLLRGSPLQILPRKS